MEDEHPTAEIPIPNINADRILQSPEKRRPAVLRALILGLEFACSGYLGNPLTSRRMRLHFFSRENESNICASTKKHHGTLESRAYHYPVIYV